MNNYGQYATAAAVTAGVAGSACVAYYLYKESQKTKLPTEWREVGKVKTIDIFPIKSCGPIRVDNVECTILGIKHGWLRDRLLMIVDSKNNFITARGYPQLVLTQSSIKGSILTLTHPEMQDSLDVDLAEVAAVEKPENAVVWGISVSVLDCGKKASDWFNRLLNKPDNNFKLMYYASQKPRQLKLKHNFFKYTPDDTGALGDEISFSLMNEASVQDLNARLKTTQVSPLLFRANFLVEGAQPFDEDKWRFIKIGGNVFENIQPTLRCLMTTIDPETGVRYPANEPLEVLRGYRKIEDPELRRKEGNAPRLGVQMALRTPVGGQVSRGDVVYVA